MYLTRKFVLFSRRGRTAPGFKSLYEAGRLDIVYECIVASLFLSHGIRRNVEFKTFLNGPPSPPLRLEIKGAELRDVRTDADTWKHILENLLLGKTHPGISVAKTSFERFLKEEAGRMPVYVLEEGGKDISQISLNEEAMFILGDQVGLPKKTENLALRYGEKLSLGKQPYLAASCITVINYLLDRKITGMPPYLPTNHLQ